jgi:phospholipid/cholesterol/gamma-HCH transport system ATP-binding protein
MTVTSDRPVRPAGSEDLATAITRALAAGGPGIGRLTHADTSVRFRTHGSPDVVLLLDRDPCELGDEASMTEVEIELGAEQAAALAAGCLPMTAALLSGAVTATGPVRRYLEVDPILRHALAATAEGAADLTPTSAGTPWSEGPIDQGLLAVQTRDLHKSFGSTDVLTGLDLAIPEGVISVLLGPSGTGKSVCLMHLIGLLRPDAGDVLIRGRALSAMSTHELLDLRRSIGVMFQDGALFSAHTVRENVAFPLRQHTDFTRAEIDEIVDEHLASVGLAHAGELMPNQLSGGMRKRAGLARALALSPSIVLVDEPDSGLDPVRTSLLGELLVERHSDHGGTMVVVTHNVMLARSISDHISVLWQGKVLEAGMTEQILASRSPFIEQFLAGEARGPLTMDA